MTETSIITVPFRDEQITCVATPEKEFVPIKPLCERLGIDFSTQRRKLRSRSEHWGVVIMTIPSSGGEQEMVCIPRGRVWAWLADINVKKVRPELQEVIRRYQTEAADVLDAYFNGRLSELDQENARLRQQLGVCHSFLTLFSPKWQMIRLLHGRGFSLPTVAARVNWTQTRVTEELEMMEDCGLSPLYGAENSITVAEHERHRMNMARDLFSELGSQNATANGDLFDA